MAVIKREQPQDDRPVEASQVGALLREARSRTGNSLHRISETLRIRAVHLQAIEDGRFADLPGATYAVGFVRSYADHLGLDGEEVVRRFKSEIADGLAARTELVFPSPVSEGRIPGVPVILVALLLAAGAYGGWYYLSSRQEPKVAEIVAPPPPEQAKESSVEGEPVAPAPSGQEAGGTAAPAAPPVGRSEVVPPAEADADMPPTTPTGEAAPAVTAAPSSAPAAIAPAPSPAAAARKTAPPPAAAVPAIPENISPAFAGRVYGQTNAESRVTLRAVEDSWIQVRDGQGNLLQARLLSKGDSYLVPDRPGLKLVTGNAGGLEIVVDGKPLPRLGEKGVVRRDISLDPADLLAGR